MPENANAFKRHIESHSDIVFTGHEHLPDTYVKEHGAESASTFVEAPPLYQDARTGSAFNVLRIDTGARTYEVMTYTWNGELYESGRIGITREFTRNPARPTTRFSNTRDFANYLDDLGTGFTHPRRDPLSSMASNMIPSMPGAERRVS